jgi:TonB-linked SusC/RagA family outer membrane protein
VNLSGYLQDKNDPILFSQDAASAGTESYYRLLLANFSDKPSIIGADNTPTGGDLSGSQGPYGMLNRSGFRITTTNSINSTIGFEQNLSFLTKGLSARAVVSYDPMATHIRGYRRTWATYNAILGKSPAGKDTVTYVFGGGNAETGLMSTLTQSLQLSYDLQASLNYNNTFGKHAVTGMLLFNQNQRIINVQVPYNYVGIVGRLTYDCANRYLAEVNFGYNGSEQFAPGKRFGFFPSFSAGWVVSEENFLKSSNAIQFMKIRGSFGKVGNDQISGSRFVYLDDWTQGTGGYFNGVRAIAGLPTFVYQNSIPNPDVSWEVANKYNFGFESKFLKGFGLDFDLFYEKRSSILLTRSVVPAYMLGQLSLPPTNTGVMENKGFEATLSYQKQVNQDLFLKTTFSTSFAKNNVIKANEVANDSTFTYRNRIEGYSLGTVWGYHNLGYFKDQADIDASPSQTGLGSVVMPGDLKYADLNHDGKIDVKEQMPMKYPLVPQLNLAFTFTAQYKGFDMSVLLQGVTNYNYDFSGRQIWDYSGNEANVINNILLKNYYTPNLYAWTPEKAANGGDIRYPRLHTDGNSCSKQISDYWEINLWYMRVKNVELGYTLPKKLSSKIGMSDLRIYFNALNMFTFSNMPFKILDPEVTFSGSHPISKNFNLGVNISF